jgi:hypothetical protein
MAAANGKNREKAKNNGSKTPRRKSVKYLPDDNTEGGNREGNAMGYSAEMLAALSDADLDDVIEEMVIGRQPEPGLLQRLKKGAVRRLSRNDVEFPAYSSSHAGMGLVMEAMLAKGFTIAVAPGGVVWVAGNGKELKYVGGVAMPRAVAIAAVLAVQGA